MDSWGLGIILYEMLHFKRVHAHTNFAINKEHISKQLFELLSSLLKPNGEDRIKISDIYDSEWMIQMAHNSGIDLHAVRRNLKKRKSVDCEYAQSKDKFYYKVVDFKSSKSQETPTEKPSQIRKHELFRGKTAEPSLDLLTKASTGSKAYGIKASLKGQNRSKNKNNGGIWGTLVGMFGCT